MVTAGEEDRRMVSIESILFYSWKKIWNKNGKMVEFRGSNNEYTGVDYVILWKL